MTVDDYILSKLFIHFEHIDPFDVEDCLHPFIANDFSLVFGILEALGFNIVPYMLDHLWTRKLFFS